MYLRGPQVKAAVVAMIWGIVVDKAPQKLREERGQKTTVRPVGERSRQDLIEARAVRAVTADEATTRQVRLEQGRGSPKETQGTSR